MARAIIQSLKALDLEEKILNGAACVGILGVFLPWISGEWLGTEDTTSYSGLGFFTSFLGLCVFLLLIFTVAVAVVPALGGPVIVKKRIRDVVRLVTSAQAAVLVMASLSVLTRITFEFSRMHVRFGIYVTLVASLVTTLYAAMRFHEHRRETSRGFFHHPENTEILEKKETIVPPPAPPPPPALDAEEHRLYP